MTIQAAFILRSSTVADRYEFDMQNHSWCSKHIYQAQPPHTLQTSLLEGTNFDPRLRSSYGHDTITSTYRDTKNLKFQISPFYIKNVHKIYKGKVNYKNGPMDIQK